MRFVRSDTSLKNKDKDKRNSHRNNSETHFHFSNRSINFPKERETKGELSFVVDRAGEKNAPTADGCTKSHGLPMYTSTLPLQKLADHTKEAKNESITSESKVQPTRPLAKRLENIPRKHVLRTQLSNRYSTSKIASAGRYHVEDDPRFSALKPGIISESLRDALGISHHQLPLYIYNMRRLGYPPGHLENARRQQSGILIFTKDRCEVTACGKVLEEGEVDDGQEEVQFDIDKLIDFPGFNIHPPDGTLDECESLDLPSMQADHSKEEMIRLLSSAHGKESMNDAEQNLEEACLKESEHSPTIHFDSKATEKRKSYSDEKMAFWLSEMGLSPADGWFILDSLPELDDDYCELSTCPNPPDRSLPSEQSQTHSVHEMQMPNPSVSLDECLTPGKTSNEVLPSTSRGSMVEIELCSDGDFSDSAMTMSGDFEEIKSSVYGGSLDVSSGTPVAVDSMFGSKGLPDASCFSLGMCEALPFENLPNATGAFRKLRKVLTAARCKRMRLTRATDAIR